MHERAFASFLLFVACLAGALLGSSATPSFARADERVPSNAVRDRDSANTGRAEPSAELTPLPDPGSVAGPDTSDVLYPRERIPIRFDHARHVEKLGLTCVYCHTQATTSRKTGDRLLAPAERCDACHGTNHDQLEHVGKGVGRASDCAFCHAGYDEKSGNEVARVVLPGAFIRSDHAAHFARGIACTKCHADLTAPHGANETTTTNSARPKMGVCVECHATGGSARADCDLCHLTVEGRLRTSFPTGELMPPAWMHGLEHGPDWILRHKIVAGADSAQCATCHSERECTDCHDGRVRPRNVHPNDWLNLHAMAARQNDPTCTSCHREQSFCVSCHQRVGIAQSSPYGDLGDRGRFHPPKSVWSDLPRTSAHHAWEAERNISACVSCHTEKDCVLCHATALKGGRGGLSPHPPGFQASCRVALSKNARPCLFCHDSSDQSLAECR